MYSLAELLELGFEFDINLDCPYLWGIVEVSIPPGVPACYRSDFKRLRFSVADLQDFFYQLFTPVSVLPSASPVESLAEVPASVPALPAVSLLDDVQASLSILPPVHASAESLALSPLAAEPSLSAAAASPSPAPGLDVQAFPVASSAPSLRPLRRRLPTVPLFALALGKSHLRQGVFRIRPPVRRANPCRAGPSSVRLRCCA